MVEDLFVFFYPVVTLMAIVGYIPQLVSLLRQPNKVEGISLSSWYLWTFSSFLTTGYAVSHIGDLFFIISSGTNLFFCALITGMLLLCRYRFQLRQDMAVVEAD